MGRIFSIAICLSFMVPSVQSVLQLERVDSDDILSTAKTLYGGDHYVIHAADEPNFAAAFPQHELFIVNNVTTIPPQTALMAVRSGTMVAFDITRDWRDLIADAGYTVLDASKSMLLGRAFAAVGHASLGIDRILLTQADSTWLNRTVTNPSVTTGLGTWTFKAWTWSATNGRLSQWTIRTSPTAVTDAKMHVKDLGVGPYGITLETAILLPDDMITTTFSPYGQTGLRNTSSPTPTTLDLSIPAADATCPVTTTATNFDGSQWSACYVGSSTPPPSIATLGQALADGGVAAYAKMIRNNPNCSATENPHANMDFIAPPSDCTIQVGMLRTIQVQGIYVAIPGCPSTPPACVEFGRIYIHPYFREFLLALGAYTEPTITASDLAESVIGHEYLHLIQEDIRGTYSEAFDESQARFIETILDPQLSHRADSLFFHNSQIGGSQGPQKLQLQPTTDYCREKYSGALLIAHAYAVTGNEGTFHRRLIENSTVDCAAGSISAAISTALSTSITMNFEDFFTNLALRMYTRDFTWTASDNSRRDWGLYLLPVTTETLFEGNTISKELMRSRVYYPIPAQGGTLSCAGAARAIIIWSLSGVVSTSTCPSDAITLGNNSSALAVVGISHRDGDERNQFTITWEGAT